MGRSSGEGEVVMNLIESCRHNFEQTLHSLQYKLEHSNITVDCEYRVLGRLIIKKVTTADKEQGVYYRQLASLAPIPKSGKIPGPPPSDPPRRDIMFPLHADLRIPYTRSKYNENVLKLPLKFLKVQK